MANAPAYNPNLTTKEAIVGAGYGGYASWNDTASILKDYQETGGSGKFTGGGTDFSTPPESSDQLPGFLADFQKTTLESLSALKPVEAPTFEELKNNLTPATPAPTPISRVETRQQLRTQYGVGDLETELNKIKTEETRITDELRALTGTEEGKPVAMNVISGRISEEERVAQQRLDAVIRQKNSIVNELNTKYSVIETYVKDLGLDYNDAVEAYNTEFDRNYKIQNMVSELSGKAFDQKLSVLKTGVDITMDAAKFQQTVKQQNIDNAKANLSTMVNAITSGNLSYDSMSPDQKLNIQKLEVQSGLPVGTISRMGMSNKDKILAFSSDNTQAWVVGGDGNMKVISTGLTKSSAGTASEREAAVKNTTLNKVKAAASHGVTLNELISMYAGTSGVTATDIYEAYNQSSSWGPAKESAEDLAKLGVKTINNSSSTPTSY